MTRMLNIYSRGRLELQPGRLNATEPTVVAERSMEEGLLEREGFVETLIAAGTFVRRGNPVTGVLQSNGVGHKFYKGLE